MDVNYFVCTLGQAALPGIRRPFNNVNDLIIKQASQQSYAAAIGFYQRGASHEEGYHPVVFTFAEVEHGIQAVAEVLAGKVPASQPQTIGLLCSSSPVFFFSWLALIRLGHPALLIAPQCSASAIAHLSKACEASLLFHDQAHQKLANNAATYSDAIEYPELTAYALPVLDDEELFKIIKRPLKRKIPQPAASPTDTAYLHHSSGTSTGIPKPIPQTNHGAVGVLPSLDGSASATFTTTPLYHGAPADIFRAWTSNALIWLFPAQYAPITATNIIKCLDASNRAVTDLKVPPVKYFSSVPYVLQAMAQEKQGLKCLQQMDLVGVGGAALPLEVGDTLVKQGINLLSRYGSAECGFLMSSHRDYQNDKQWDYLRHATEVHQLQFEPNGDGQSELVVLSGWPHMAKTNRDLCSFATADLFAPHPHIANAWRYHSRADAQLTLVTGKKFDPSPLENNLIAACSVLSEVLIFGNGKEYPGALIFRSVIAKDLSDFELVQQVAPEMEALNAEIQQHSRISRSMLIPMAYADGALEKSSKGTILRGVAEEKYRQQIEKAYQQDVSNDEEVDDEEVSTAVMKIVKSTIGTLPDDHSQFDETTDLFAYGVDSIACAQIRRAVGRLLPNNANALPLTVVEDAGNVSSLSEVVLRVRKGQPAHLESNQDDLIHDLVQRYSVFKDSHSQSSTETPQDTGVTILMTGPTGSLGAHILSQLLEDPMVGRIHLLIRGSTTHAAEERVLKALSSRHLSSSNAFDTKVNVMACKLSDPRLGLSDIDYETLMTEVDMIFHLAWSVNFLVSLRSLASTHLAGLQNLLNLALSSNKPTPPRFFFCSSVASVSNTPNTTTSSVPETIISDPSACGATGYAKSKLAGELICANCAQNTRLQDRISILRVGQLSGDTKHGAWNTTEAYPLILAGSKATGVLPNLSNEPLTWLPVDIAAKCFIESALNTDKTTRDGTGVKVLHLLNPSTTTKFPDLLQCLHDAGEKFTSVLPDEWLAKLEALQTDSGNSQRHAALVKLLPFWKDIYGSRIESQSRGSQIHDNGEEGSAADGASSQEVLGGYVMTNSLRAMPSLKAAVGPLESEYMLRLWRWVMQEDFGLGLEQAKP